MLVNGSESGVDLEMHGAAAFCGVELEPPQLSVQEAEIEQLYVILRLFRIELASRCPCL